MRLLKLCIYLLLLVTTPTLLALPSYTSASISKKLNKNFKKEKRYPLATYDEILILLDEIESGKAEKKYNSKDRKRIDRYLVYLACEGIVPGHTETISLETDIAQLLDNKDSFSDLGHGICRASPIHENLAAKSWFSSGWKKTKSFAKKHKTEIIIGAVIIVATATVIVAVAAASTGAATAVAGLAGGASSSICKDTSTPKSNSISTINAETEIDLGEQVTSFKETLGTQNLFQSQSSEGLSIEETGKVLAPLLAHESLKRFQENHTPPTLGHQQIDQTFSSDYSPYFVNPATETDFTSLTYHMCGEKAFDTGYYNQAIDDFSKALEISPTNLSPRLDRSAAYFSLGNYDQALEDFQEYISQRPPTQTFSMPEFSMGFAKGLPKGVYESGEGLFFFLSDCVTHPIQTCEQMWEALTLLNNLARSEEWAAIGEALAPEIHQLITQWDTIPSDERGELAGYAFGKYGSDILIPGAAVKIASKGIKGAKELSVVSRTLKSAEKTLLLETSAGLESGAKISEVIHKGKEASFLGKEMGFSSAEMGQLKKAGKLEGSINNRLDRLINQSESEVFKSVNSQNKHIKMVRDYLDKPAKEIQKGIDSYTKQITIHKDKISNPTKYYPDWDKLDPRRREALINKKWPAETNGYKEQRDILQSILNERISYER